MPQSLAIATRFTELCRPGLGCHHPLHTPWSYVYCNPMLMMPWMLGGRWLGVEQQGWWGLEIRAQGLPSPDVDIKRWLDRGLKGRLWFGVYEVRLWLPPAAWMTLGRLHKDVWYAAVHSGSKWHHLGCWATPGCLGRGFLGTSTLLTASPAPGTYHLEKSQMLVSGA